MRITNRRPLVSDQKPILARQDNRPTANAPITQPNSTKLAPKLRTNSGKVGNCDAKLDQNNNPLQNAAHKLRRTGGSKLLKGIEKPITKPN